MKWAVTRLCRPTGYGDYLWASRPMFSAVGLFLGLKSKILHEQNVIHFQFYIRLPNCRLLGSIIFKKSPIWSIPLSILYRLFFESQGRKYGRILSWSWSVYNIEIQGSLYVWKVKFRTQEWNYCQYHFVAWLIAVAKEH